MQPELSVILKSRPMGGFLLFAFAADGAEGHAEEAALFAVRVEEADDGVAVRFAHGVEAGHCHMAFQSAVATGGER